MDRIAIAKRLLVHYFRTAFEAAGKGWDGDNTAEVNNLVDCIVEAAMRAAVSEIATREARRVTGRDDIEVHWNDEK